MEQKTMETKLNKIFDVGDKKYQASLFVNMRLLTMPKDMLVEMCHEFGLYPVEKYLDTRIIESDEGNWNIRGFIRYMDIYLIENSGGNRKNLVQLGENLTKKKPSAFSPRLLRMEIISAYLSTIQ